MLHDPKFPQFWNDGSARSLGNCFTQTFDGGFRWEAFNTQHRARMAQTKRIERARANGDTSGTIARLSKAGDAQRAANFDYWHAQQRNPKSVDIEPAKDRAANIAKRDKLRRGTL